MSKELEKAIELVKRTIHPSTFAKKGQALRLVIEAAERDLQSRQAMKDIPPDTALAPKRFDEEGEVEKQIILSFLQKVIESDDPFLVETLIDEIRFGTPERLTAFIEKVEGEK